MILKHILSTLGHNLVKSHFLKMQLLAVSPTALLIQLGMAVVRSVEHTAAHLPAFIQGTATDLF